MLAPREAALSRSPDYNLKAEAPRAHHRASLDVDHVTMLFH